jgi:hypothetical protein
MSYKGFIKKSRTYDHAAISQIIDGAAGIFVMYSPEQLGIAVPIYMLIRILLNAGAVWLRKDTTGPVGDK